VYAFVSPDRPDTVTMVANYTDDTLAGAWYKNGRTTEAARATHRALRLGTEDAMLHYHAGMIAAASGRARIARRHLRRALALDPHFDLRQAPRARVTLAALARPAPEGG
jgi:Flp pilus assembly protein TadD